MGHPIPNAHSDHRRRNLRSSILIHQGAPGAVNSALNPLIAQGGNWELNSDPIAATSCWGAPSKGPASFQLFVDTALSTIPVGRPLLQTRCDGASNDVFQWSMVLILMMTSVQCDSAGTAPVLDVEDAATSRTKWVNLAYPRRATRRPAVPPF